MKRSTRIILLILAAALIAGGIYVWCNYLQPIEYPALSGPYPVGRLAYDLVDESRAETFTDDPQDKRELMVYIWYPAEVPAGAQRANIADADFERAILPEKLPGFLSGLSLAYLNQIHVHSYLDVPVADAQASYPVILMSHGDGGSPLYYASIAEDLASNGYIVAGISHTYNANFTAFPGGRIIEKTTAASAMGEPTGLVTFDGVQAMYQRAGDLVSLYAADASFVLDQLESINANDAILGGKLDLAHTGMFGHSFGGAIALETLQTDERVLAGANLDGNIWSEANAQGTDKSYLTITTLPMAETADPAASDLEKAGWTLDQYHAYMNQGNDYYFAALNSPQGTLAIIDGTEHENFTDLSLFYRRIFYDCAVGSIQPAYALRITDDLLLSFFNTALKGQAAALTDFTARYPELSIQSGGH